MKRTLLALSCLLLVTSGCSNNAKETFETAQFEEVQHNIPHARQLYERIVRDYATSEYAVKARERLAALPPGE